MSTHSTTPARLADTNWDAFIAEAGPLAAEIADRYPHLSAHQAGQAAAAMLDELIFFAAGWDSWAAERRAAAEQPADTATARARAKAEYHLAGGLEIRRAADGSALVPSGTRGGIVHRVINGRCTCEAGQVGRPCWHVAAVELAA
jgi:hypothetical protein